MKPYDLYARLELLPPEHAGAEPGAAQRSLVRRIAARSGQQLRQMGYSLVNYFCGIREPRITTRRDREGNAYFWVYDPISRTHHYFVSEAEVRTWLDQRYYQ